MPDKKLSDKKQLDWYAQYPNPLANARIDEVPALFAKKSIDGRWYAPKGSERRSMASSGKVAWDARIACR